jgi:putative transposase
VARSIRIEYPGAFYHVMARGNRREEIFRGEKDRQLFLNTLGEACTRSGWRVHGWALMSNHYHLFLGINNRGQSTNRDRLAAWI